MLKFVRDIMHTGEAIPVKPLGAKMSDALVEMSSKGFGCVCIVDAKRRDRRHHHRWRSAPSHAARPDDRAGRRGDDESPRTIPPGMLATEMLETLNSSKPAVTVLIVAEGNKPVGIVHVHDVLRAGVA